MYVCVRKVTAHGNQQVRSRAVSGKNADLGYSGRVAGVMVLEAAGMIGKEVARIEAERVGEMLVRKRLRRRIAWSPDILGQKRA